MEPEKKNENSELEAIELDEKQLDRIAGGNAPDICTSCGADYIKTFPSGLSICVNCGALYSWPVD